MVTKMKVPKREREGERVPINRLNQKKAQTLTTRPIRTSTTVIFAEGIPYGIYMAISLYTSILFYVSGIQASSSLPFPSSSRPDTALSRCCN